VWCLLVAHTRSWRGRPLIIFVSFWPDGNLGPLPQRDRCRKRGGVASSRENTAVAHPRQFSRVTRIRREQAGSRLRVNPGFIGPWGKTEKWWPRLQTDAAVLGVPSAVHYVDLAEFLVPRLLKRGDACVA
jgi:hypothetical protein